MITIELKIDNNIKTIKLRDEILFNALLSQNLKLIKKLIRGTNPLYKISSTFLRVVNKYVDVREDGTTLYGGLIVRTNFDSFAVLYLKDSILDDDYIVEIIEEFLNDTGENMTMNIEVNKIEIDKSSFFKSLK